MVETLKTFVVSPGLPAPELDTGINGFECFPDILHTNGKEKDFSKSVAKLTDILHNTLVPGDSVNLKRKSPNTILTTPTEGPDGSLHRYQNHFKLEMHFGLQLQEGQTFDLDMLSQRENSALTFEKIDDFEEGYLLAPKLDEKTEQNGGKIYIPQVQIKIDNNGTVTFSTVGHNSEPGHLMPPKLGSTEEKITNYFTVIQLFTRLLYKTFGDERDVQPVICEAIIRKSMIERNNHLPKL